ncbi:hypothetical protein Tco_0351802, partial [Tanacetum coccineum]
YLKGKPKLGLWYPRVSSFDLEAYSDSDYAGANLDRKSTTGEAEYVAATNCCGQVLWIQNQMLDYGFNFMNTKIYIDNESTICIVKNLVFHSKTKHIEIRHHFIRDAYEKKLIQFWNTNTSKIVNNVSYIKAKVAGKIVSISEASIRLDLLFNDVDGIDCLTNQEIYENLQLMGYEGDLTILTFQKALFSPQWKYLIHTIIHCLSSKSTSWDQFPTNIASALICLATDRKFNFSKMIFEGMIRNLDTKKQFLMYPRFVQVFLNNQLSNLPAPLNNLPIPVLTKKVFTNMAKQGLHFSGHVTPLFPNMLAQAVVDEGEGSEQPTEPQPTPSTTQPSTGDQPPIPHDSPLLGGHTSDRAEGGLNIEELSILCTNFSNRVLVLETSKGAQAAKILKLKARIKKPKKKCQPVISHHKAWLRSVSRLSMKKKLGKKEFVSKQGRKNAKLGLKLDDSTFDNLDADLAHGMDDMEIKEVVNEGRQRNETEELNLDADTEVIAEDKGRDTLVKMKDNKAKGVVFKNTEELVRPARLVLTLKPLPSIYLKDKGKDVLEEPELTNKMTRSDFDAAQVDRDAEVARQLEVELQAEVERERQREEQASMDYIANLYDEVQAITADHELAVRLTHEEQENYTVDERAKLLAEFFERRKKQLAEERAAAIKNKPPTRTQLRSLMMTYLKHTGRFKHSQLNKRTLEEIHAIYIKEQERATNFVPIGSEEDERLIQKMNKRAAGVHVEKVLEEPNSTKVEVMQEADEKNKKDVVESSEKGTYASKKRNRGPRMKIQSKRKKTDSDLEEEEHLKTSLKIVPDEEGIIDFEVPEKRFPIINWESKFYDFDRHGAECIYYRIFRFDGSSRWIKTFSKMVTRTMFEANAEDELWQNQEGWNLKSWDFYENYGVHTLTLEDGTEIHMLAERRYPLTKETLERMMSLKLIAESASDSAYDLLRFIQKQIDEAGSHDGGEKDL